MGLIDNLVEVGIENFDDVFEDGFLFIMCNTNIDLLVLEVLFTT